MDLTTLGAWSSRLSPDLRLRRSELLDRHVRRLPALSPPLGARGRQPALRPALALGAGLDFVLSATTGRTTRPAVPARRPHHRHDDAADEHRPRTVALRHGARRVRRGPVERRRRGCASSPACASTTTTSSRPTSSRRSAARAALGGDAAASRSRARSASTTSCRTPEFLDRQFGNPNLSLSWADQYQLGVERKFTDADELTATAFFVRRHDLPVASIDHFSSMGQGRAYGLELLLRHEVTEHFYGWIAYTLSRSEVAGTLAEGVPMGMTGMPRNGGDLSWRPGQFDQTHNLIVVASYSFRGWETGVSYRLVTGTPRTPVDGLVLRRRLQRLHAPERRAGLGAQRDLQPARRAHRAAVHLRPLGAGRLRRHHERVQLRERGGRALRLSLAPVGADARACRSCRSSA